LPVLFVPIPMPSTEPHFSCSVYLPPQLHFTLVVAASELE
jgi:hypothetical protein